MEWFVAVGAVVLLAVLIVGLFHGPSHRDVRKRAPEHKTPPDAAAPIGPPGPAVYVLPPPRRRRLAGRRSARRPGGRRS